MQARRVCFDVNAWLDPCRGASSVDDVVRARKPALKLVQALAASSARLGVQLVSGTHITGTLEYVLVNQFGWSAADAKTWRGFVEHLVTATGGEIAGPVTLSPRERASASVRGVGDAEDALVEATARRLGATAIVTGDREFLRSQNDGIERWTLAAFAAVLAERHAARRDDALVAA